MAYQPPDASQHFSQPIQPSPSQPIYPYPSGPMPPTQPYPPQYPAQPFPQQPYQQPVYPPQGYPPGYYPPQYQMQGPYPPGYYPYQQPGWAPRRMNHHAETAQTLGVLSLLLGVIFGIPAIIFAVMARSEIAGTGEDGMSKANTGLFLGILSFVWMVGYYYWFFLPR